MDSNDESEPLLFESSLSRKPFKFYLCHPLDGIAKLNYLISSHGGEIVTNTEEDVLLLAKDVEIPQSLLDNHTVYDYRLILESAEAGRFLDLNDYVISIPSKPSGLLGSSSTQSDGTKSRRTRLFSQEEDDRLIEEIRKRPWMGFRGHAIYKQIASLEFFRDRARTYTSLRERMRTKKYPIEFLYVADSNHNLLTDEFGNYLKNEDIENAPRDISSTSFTALDEFILARHIYKTVKFQPDPHNFEQIPYPSGFFEDFHKNYPHHPTDSWRHRAQKFVQVFGVVNYLKYYIKTKQSGQSPEVTSRALEGTEYSNWMGARRLSKKVDPPPTLFYPLASTISDDVLDSIDTIEPLNNDFFASVKRSNPLLRNPVPDEPEELNKPVKKRRLEPPISANEKSKVTDKTPPVISDSPPSDSSQPVAVKPATAESEISNLAVTEFVDAYTARFPEDFFPDVVRENKPIEPTAYENKKVFFDKLKKIDKSLTPAELIDALTAIGVNQYYSTFLLGRCTRHKSTDRFENIISSIKEYVESQGKHLLCIRPGVWSDLAIGMLKEGKEESFRKLVNYHGLPIVKRREKHERRVIGN